MMFMILEHVIKQLLNYLLTNAPNILVERYKLKEEEMTDVDTILESIGRRRGLSYVSGGIGDFGKGSPYYLARLPPQY